MTAPAVPTPTPAVEGVVEDETEKADSDSEIPRKKMRIWDESNEEYQCCRCHYKSMSGRKVHTFSNFRLRPTRAPPRT